jgi:hypothetical protein
MKLVPTLLLLAVLAAVAPSLAHASGQRVSFGCGSCGDSPVEWAPRHPVAASRLAITTTNRSITLLLTDDEVAMQLSDPAFHKATRDLRRDAGEHDDNVLGEAIRTAVVAGVGSLLDHSARCPLSELRDVTYANGRLALTSVNGRPVYQDADTDDEDVLASFSERDARAFVREFQRAKATRR